MTNKDKTILLAGMMFNVTFFLSMMMSVFITNAAAFALLVATLTYLFSIILLQNGGMNMNLIEQVREKWKRKLKRK